MSKRTFTKYQGTGNDFVIIDHRTNPWIDHKDKETIRQICDRRFGVGADGLILLEEEAGYDFKMVYFNADGNESSMCGNGGRCIIAYAKSLGIIHDTCKFLAIDGDHIGKINGAEIHLQMKNVDESICNGSDYILDTGSPHFVRFLDDKAGLNVVEHGKMIRYSEAFKEDGINVNFVNEIEGGIEVATYERGVEDETLSCGTGVTAAALSYALAMDLNAGNHEHFVKSKGGDLRVKFQYDKATQSFNDVWLIGPAEKVFEGLI